MIYEVENLEARAEVKIVEIDFSLGEFKPFFEIS